MNDDAHYFAYGTLLDIAYFRQYCPSVEPVGVMRLKDHELDFASCQGGERGGCTLRSAQGAETWGIQFRMTQEDLQRLEEISGIPTGDWAWKDISVDDGKGASVATRTFFVPNASGPYVPPDSYVAPILKGALENALPESYVARLREIIRTAQGTPASR